MSNTERKVFVKHGTVFTLIETIKRNIRVLTSLILRKIVVRMVVVNVDNV